MQRTDERPIVSSTWESPFKDWKLYQGATQLWGDCRCRGGGGGPDLQRRAKNAPRVTSDFLHWARGHPLSQECRHGGYTLGEVLKKDFQVQKGEKSFRHPGVN